MTKNILVWIFQTGEPIHTDDGKDRPMRAMNLTNELTKLGHSVVLFSSAFYHQKKIHRSKNFKHIAISQKLMIKLIPSIGYKKNIGILRIIDHIHLAINLRKLIKNESTLPDIAFIGYPPIETSYYLVNWLLKRNIPTLLDVKDLWPVIFLDTLPKYLRKLGECLLFPYFSIARNTMQKATGITTMTSKFLEWTLEFSEKKRCKYDKIFPLTSKTGELSQSQIKSAKEWWDAYEIKSPQNEFRIVFIGSFMSIFDFESIRDAAKEIEKSKLPIKFILCGDGGNFKKVKNLMNGLSNVLFPGWIDRAKVEVLADRCNVSIAPYLNINNYIYNTPNKIVDSFALGLPLLSPLHGEVANLIKEHKVGMQYGHEASNKLIDCINIMIKKPQMMNQFSRNAITLYEQKFSYDKIYNSLAKHVYNTSKRFKI